MNPYDLAQKVKRIRYLLLDVDGVLTDGGIYYSSSGDEYLRFNVKDGQGIELLQEQGYKIGICSGRMSEIARRRAEELGIKDVFLGASSKLAIYEQIKATEGLIDEEIAYIGDDVNDIPVLEKCGLAVTVSNGSREVRRYAHYVTRAPGGRGAVREIIDLFLTILRKYPKATSTYHSRR